MSAKSMTACRAQARASAVATWSMCEKISVFAESIEFRIRCVASSSDSSFREAYAW
ncbi:hypothetical protein [Streptomyces turgidiscabies]|uniref:Uncharacterized protein n=1 Tax=Streptomyces turgidiscabies TaxID=85558 RepID=A0ABU0RJ87_9ACTN|nr:hypothetical protein [Streptomyces turgidiscabies]MDQ0931202.1 hypothetical protein [Streptomyces turgidiscabies]